MAYDVKAVKKQWEGYETHNVIQLPLGACAWTKGRLDEVAERGKGWMERGKGWMEGVTAAEAVGRQKLSRSLEP